MKKLLFFLLPISVVLFPGCREDDETVADTATVNLKGYVQKGPFINGTAIMLSELNPKLIATGRTFTTQIADNKGLFTLVDIPLQSNCVQLQADGFYFDEVQGEKSAAQLTLFALADVSGASTVNINLLSHLERSRVIYLMQEEKTKFAAAKTQAQQEILAAFGIEQGNMSYAEQLDISQDGDQNAILLTISAILQSNNTVAELSELLANITTDLREDGVLTSETLQARLKAQAISLNLPQIRKNLEDRYEEMGVSATIPNFEQYVDSDGDGILNKDEDDTPDDFAFKPQVDVAVDTVVVSNEVIISGLKKDGKSNVSISNGHLIINGQVVNDSTAQVKNMDRVQVALRSSNQFSTETTASLRIESFTATFRVVTDAYSPSDFSFASIIDATRNAVYRSDTITITGLPHPTPAKTVWFSTDSHLAGAIYINGTKYTDNSFNLIEGDQVWIEITSGEKYSTTISSSLIINDKEALFSVMTESNSWKAKLPLTMGAFHGRPAGFSIGDKVYFGTGSTDDGSTKAFYEYDPTTNKLTQKADFGGSARAEGIGFSIGQVGYIGLGIGENLGEAREFYRYDPDTDTWTELASYPGKITWLSIGFSMNGKGYVGLGGIQNDFWEYNPTTDIWTELASLPAEGRLSAIAFSVNKKGYVGLGIGDHSGKNDFWEYDPASDSWRQLSDCPGPLGGGVGFSIGENAYIGKTCTKNLNTESQFFKYDPSNDSWESIDIEDMNFSGAMTIGTSTKAYHISNEFQDSRNSSGFYEFTPPQD